MTLCTIVNLSLPCPTNTVLKGLLQNKYVVSKGVITIYYNHYFTCSHDDCYIK